MGRNIVHAGEAGAGQAAKLCNNMLLGIGMIGAAEALVLADRLGLERQKLFDIVKNSSGANWSLTNYCPAPGPVPTAPSNRDYAAGFAVNLMLKDLTLAQEAANDSGAATPLGAHAARLYAALAETGEGRARLLRDLPLARRGGARRGALMAAAFKAARDFLLAQRGDYATAYAQFRWPVLEKFNWALDWFDAELARGATRDATALLITGANEARLSFGELAARSNRVANGLRALGVGRGDRILLMLGNVAALWETMLAAMKLGAVVVPATTLLTAADIAERVARARVRAVVIGAADAEKVAALTVPRIVVGGAPSAISYGKSIKAF